MFQRSVEQKKRVADQMAVGVVTTSKLWEKFMRENPRGARSASAFEMFLKKELLWNKFIFDNPDTSLTFEEFALSDTSVPSVPTGRIWDDLGRCKADAGRFQFDVAVTPKGRISLLAQGGFGTVVGGTLLLDPQKKPVVLKMSTAVGAGAKEYDMGLILNERLLNDRMTPHVIRTYSSFLCKGIPPRQGAWEQVVDKLLFIDTAPVGIDTLDEARDNGVFYIVTQRAEGVPGTKVVTINDMRVEGFQVTRGLVRSFAFQILFTLAAMKEIGFQHRDIQSSNVLITTTSDQNRLYWTQGREGGRREYYDPLSEQGQQDPRLDIKFIDFGLSATSTNDTPYVRVMIFYRPPEMMFAWTVDQNRGVLKENEDPDRLPYGPESDLFAAALVILAAAWRDPLADVMTNMPVYPPPPGLIGAINKAKTMAILRGTLRLGLAMGFSFADDVERISIWLWNIVHAIGMPTEHDWPNVTGDPLYTILKKHEMHMHPVAKRGGWVRSRFVLGLLGPSGQDAIVKMLSWDPRNRGRAIDYIRTSTYFSFIRAKGALLALKNDDDKVPRWGFREGGSAPAKKIESTVPIRHPIVY